jgi:glucose/arabinose dehydrogenase
VENLFCVSLSKTLASKFLFFSTLVIILTISNAGLCSAQGNSGTIKPTNLPILTDPALKVELVFKGIKFPTSMAFLGPNDILVLEKNNGTVIGIKNGQIMPAPLLDVNVSSQSERGMLGIAVAKNVTRNVTYVFLYYTEAATKDGDDVTAGKEPLGNRLYRYELGNDKLINPKLLLDLPATPGPTHNGGKIVIGPDNYVYLVIGMVGTTADVKTQTQNVKSGSGPDGRGGILRITQDGKPVSGSGILGNTFPLNIYNAYGIRNSFGIGFDPITGKLWDTENGGNFGDEINLVEPGFNSGWNKVQGIWQSYKGNPGNITLDPHNLVSFGKKGKYQAPKFIWLNSSGPTGLRFLNNDILGKKFENDLFVGDFHNGYLYDFNLDATRKQLVLSAPLDDKIANNKSELRSIIFGYGFGGITDLAVGPDGYLYVLSLYQYKGGTNCDPVFGNPSKPCIQYSSPEEGSIFRIMPK